MIFFRGLIWFSAMDVEDLFGAFETKAPKRPREEDGQNTESKRPR